MKIKLQSFGKRWCIKMVDTVFKKPSIIEAYSNKSTILIHYRKEIRSFEGHSSLIRVVAFSPDGKYILTGSIGGRLSYANSNFDETAKLWHIERDEEIHSFDGYTNQVNAIEFSPDGKNALIGNQDHTAKLWNVETGEEIHSFEGHSSPISAVTFSPNGRYALTGEIGSWTTRNVLVKLWKIQTYKEIRSFDGHSSSIQAMAFSSDGKYILTGSTDRKVKLWESKTGKEVHSLEGHYSSILAVAFSSDGQYVLTGSEDNTIKRWVVDIDQLIALQHQKFPLTSLTIAQLNQYDIGAIFEAIPDGWKTALVNFDHYLLRVIGDYLPFTLLFQGKHDMVYFIWSCFRRIFNFNVSVRYILVTQLSELRKRYS